MSIRLLIADDHEVVRLGIKSLLADTDLQVAAEASSGEEAIAAVRKHQPDVVLLDIRMPDMDGLSALSRLRMDYPQLNAAKPFTYSFLPCAVVAVESHYDTPRAALTE